MGVTRTYFCAGANKVGRLDDHTGPWIDISVPPSLGLIPGAVADLYDIMANPVNPDHVVVVGDLAGIYVSTNAGVTWSYPAGDHPQLQDRAWHEVWWADPNTIYVTGDEGAMAKSTDGGVTFDILSNTTLSGHDLPTPNGTNPYPLSLAGAQLSGAAIHFIDANIGVAVWNDIAGLTTTVYKTINGGVTWAPTSPPIPGSTTHKVTGIRMSQDQQIIVLVGELSITRSTDGGLNWSTPFFWPTKTGIHLTSEDDLNNLYATGNDNTLIHSTDQGATWTIQQGPIIPSPPARAAHFYNFLGGYYSVGDSIYQTPDAMLTGTLSTSLLLTINALWTQVGDDCYGLRDCRETDDPLWVPTFYTSTDLSAYLGQVIQLDEYPGTCFRPFGPSPCPCDPVCAPVTVNASFVDCDSCAFVPDICYDLISCDENVCSSIYNVGGFDFSPYLGQLIEINGDTSCAYTPIPVRQAFLTALDLTSDLSNPAGAFQTGDDITYRVTSLIWNGNEKIVGTPPELIFTAGAYIPLDCTEFTCTPVLPLTTENSYQNFVDFMNTVFTGVNIPLTAYANEEGHEPPPPSLIAENFVLTYSDGNIFTIIIERIDISRGTHVFTIDIAAGNVTTETSTSATVDVGYFTDNSDQFCVQTPNIAINSVVVVPNCPPPPDPPPPAFVPCDIEPRLGEPGFSVKNCDPKTVIRTKTDFSDSVYALVKRMRYGITTCCEYDLDKVDIKNELIELGTIYDPDLCIDPPIPDPCAPAPIIPAPAPALGITCPTPSNVISSIDVPIPPVPCLPPSGFPTPDGEPGPIAATITIP